MNLSVSAILLYSIVAAAVSVYLPFLLVAYARAKVGYNTSAPRAMFDQLPDYAKRATWAHQNGFETFMIYSAPLSWPTLQESPHPWPLPVRSLS